MKKGYIFLLFVLLLVFCFSACGDTPVSVDTDIETENNFEELNISVTICGEVIYPTYKNGEYTLYLPAAFSEAVWGEDALVNGVSVIKGDSADLLYTADEADINGKKVRIMRSSSIPALFLTSSDGSFDNINASPDHSYSTSGAYSLVSDSGEVISSGELKKIKGRGNSTWNGTEKKPYQIELKEKESLLGLAKAKKYVLLANYYDPSLLRNSFAFGLASLFEGYSPSAVPLDVYASGEYIGSYLLCEKIDISSEKIDIFDLEKQNEGMLSIAPEDHERGGKTEGAEAGSSKWFEFSTADAENSGGYILEVDYPERYPDEVSGFVTERGLPIVIVSPEAASREQVEYIKTFVCDFEDALYSEDGYNEKGKHYSDYADMDSFVFRYLFEEFMLNIDGGISSFHIYKDTDEKGGKLVFSCVWDYDCGLGNYNKYVDLTSPETLFAASNETRNSGSMPSWFYALVTRPEMKERINEYYRDVFSAKLREEALLLRDLAEQIRSSAEMDGDLYKNSDLSDFYGAESGDDFESAFVYLCDFIERRIAFFDTVFK